MFNFLSCPLPHKEPLLQSAQALPIESLQDEALCTANSWVIILDFTSFKLGMIWALKDREAELRETELSLIKKQVSGLRASDALECSMARVMVTGWGERRVTPSNPGYLTWD